MSDLIKRAEEVEEYGGSFKGNKEYKQYLAGERLTVRQMAIAKCYDCMGYYSDGKEDCQISSCPLYPLMPYRSGDKYASRILTPEAIGRLRERFSSRQKTTTLGGQSK
jgi:hypothetical protein